MTLCHVMFFVAILRLEWLQSNVWFQNVIILNSKMGVLE